MCERVAFDLLDIKAEIILYAASTAFRAAPDQNLKRRILLMPKLIAGLAVTAFAFLSFVPLGWAQSQWNETVEAAKREGSVVVVGPQGNETREALTLTSDRRYLWAGRH